MTTTPLVIPLGDGSRCGDDELRILLRSVEEHCSDAGRVFIATDTPPRWLSESATVVHLRDKFRHNKDANLIEKTLEVVRRYSLDCFAWAADDNVFVKDCNLASIPKMAQFHRTRKDYVGGNAWNERVLHTLDYFKIPHPMECHAPQFFGDAQELLRRMEAIRSEWEPRPGLTITTSFRCVMGDTGYRQQQPLKESAESANAVGSIRFDRMFLGYNDSAFIDGGLRKTLLEKFPNKSRWEV